MYLRWCIWHCFKTWILIKSILKSQFKKWIPPLVNDDRCGLEGGFLPYKKTKSSTSSRWILNEIWVDASIHESQDLPGEFGAKTSTTAKRSAGEKGKRGPNWLKFSVTRPFHGKFSGHHFWGNQKFMHHFHWNEKKSHKMLAVKLGKNELWGWNHGVWGLIGIYK